MLLRTSAPPTLFTLPHSQPEDSVVYKSAVPKMEKVGGDTAALREAVGASVIDSFRKFADFLEQEYRPNARSAPGVWCIPDGNRMYASCIRCVTPWFGFFCKKKKYIARRFGSEIENLYQQLAVH